MLRAWEKTIAYLTATPHESAAVTLAAALESPRAEISGAALRGLLERRHDAEGVARRAVVARWHKLPPAVQDLVTDQGLKLDAALREAVAGSDYQKFVSACGLSLKTRWCEVIPLLVMAAEDTSSRRSQMACHTLLTLADKLNEWCHAPRDYRERRDPHAILHAVLSSVELAAQRFHIHGRLEIVEAFLLLANRENPTLKRILHSPGDRLYKTLGDTLQKNVRPGIVRLLISFLEDPQAPRLALTALSRRRDETLLRELLGRGAVEWKPGVLEHLKRLESLPALEQALDSVPKFPPDEQRAAMQLAAYSSLPRPLVFLLAEQLLKRGAPQARVAAVDALNGFAVPRADELIARLALDGDPAVQARAIRQLRTRGVPGAMARLVESLDSPHELVREGARASLSEFHFTRFFELFPNLSPEVRRQTGQLVYKVDARFGEMLRHELHAPARNRRETALDIISVLRLATEYMDELVRLANEEDELTRLAAVELLAQVDAAPALSTLRERLVDLSPRVRHAAERALQWRAQPAGTASAAGAPRAAETLTPLAWEALA